MKQLLLLILCVAVCGCGTGSVEEPLTPPDYDFTGIWDGTLTGAVTSSIFVVVATQNGNDIYGTLDNDGGFTFSIDGQTWDNNITLICTDVLNSDYILTCSGTSDGTHAFGLWSDNTGSSGSWEADIR